MRIARSMTARARVSATPSETLLSRMPQVGGAPSTACPVSYTHLDVYKRQPEGFSTFRLGLFGLDKWADVDASVARLATALDEMGYPQR